MFVLSPVGPTFDLETQKSFFCRVSDHALSDGGNRFSQFGVFHTVLKRHVSIVMLLFFQYHLIKLKLRRPN